MNEIKLSIIIPVYNRAHVILRALDSVLSSSRNDIEIIVSDDGSTDNTIEILNNINDTRLIVLDNKKNKNANFARNQAIKKSSSDLITFLDSDDEFLEDRIDYLIDFFDKHKDVDILIDSFLVYKKQSQIENIDFKIGSIDNNLFKDYLISHSIPITFSTITTRKYALEEIGYLDENFGRHQDRDYLLTAINYKQKFFISNAKNVIKHQENDSFSRSYKGYLEGLDLVTLKHQDFLNKKYKNIFSYFIARVFVKSILTFNIKSLIYNYKKLKKSKALDKGILNSLFRYGKGKKERKEFKNKFFRGIYN